MSIFFDHRFMHSVGLILYALSLFAPNLTYDYFSRTAFFTFDEINKFKMAKRIKYFLFL